MLGGVSRAAVEISTRASKLNVFIVACIEPYTRLIHSWKFNERELVGAQL